MARIVCLYNRPFSRVWLVTRYLSLSLILSITSNIAGAQDCDKDRRTILFGGDAHYPPFHYKNSNQIITGFDIDIITATTNQVCLHLEKKLGEWTGILKELEMGDIDIVPMFINKLRTSRFDFSNPIIYRYHVVFGRIDSDHVESLEELNGFEVIVQEGGAAHEKLVELGLEDNLILKDGEPAAMQMLASGRHDYAVLPELIGQTAKNNEGLDNLRVVSPPLLALPYAFGINKGNIELQNLINQGLSQIKQSGQYDEIYQRWFTDIYQAQTNQVLIRNISIISISIIILLITTILYRRKKFLITIYAQARELLEEKKLRKVKEKEAQYLAYHDQVTGLPNIHKIDEICNKTISKAKENNLHAGILYFSLIEYPLLVQSIGYTTGHRLLKHIATLLQNTNTIITGTISPGVYISVIYPAEDKEDIVNTQKALINMVESIHTVDDVTLSMRCKAGLSIFPDDGNSTELLIRHAELAYTNAVNFNKHYVTYDTSLEPDPRNVRLAADLRKALMRDDELYLVYQPQLELLTNKIISAECLIRWQHPEFGQLPPIVFIPLAERTGLIQDLTKYIIKKVLQNEIENRIKHNINIKYCVNVSANDICNPDFASEITSALDHSNANLIIEVTETAATEDIDEVKRNSQILKEYGIELSIDDYGTGYSSLSYLKYLNPAELKIDQLFITDLHNDKYDQILVEKTIAMANKLNIRVVAEGVEVFETLKVLKNVNCDLVQGYYISKPLSENELSIFVNKKHLFA